MNCNKSNVTCAAFGNILEGIYTVHMVNNGATRPVTLTGLPASVKELRMWVTDSQRGMQYVVSEMLATVTAFRYRAETGALEEMQTVQLTPADYTGTKSAAEIAIHPKRKFLYASHRGDNTIALFQIDQATGLLTAVDRTSTEGKTPRNFAIDPSGGWLFTANQDSGNVVIFRIDAQALDDTEHSMLPFIEKYRSIKEAVAKFGRI